MPSKIISFFQKPGLPKRLWKKILKLFYIEQWALLVSKGKEGTDPVWEDFTLLSPSKDYFWADPFPWQVDGQDYIFYEELPFSTEKGYISCLKLGANLEIVSNEIVLERPYHLSYPFIFDYEGQLYMMPESRQNRCIEIYRCAQFPNKWEKAGTLMENVEALDATLLQHAGKWWLFVNLVEAGGNPYDSLYLFHADSPLSTKWTAHSLNPVVKDMKRARPAGRIFTQNGELIRPSQDCSIRYGYATNFNRIERLNEHEYQETTLSRFAPPENSRTLLSTHTWNETGSLRAIDAEFWRRR